MRMTGDPEFLLQKLKRDQLNGSLPQSHHPLQKELSSSCLIPLTPKSEGPHLGLSLSVGTVGDIGLTTCSPAIPSQILSESMVLDEGEGQAPTMKATGIRETEAPWPALPCGHL